MGNAIAARLWYDRTDHILEESMKRVKRNWAEVTVHSTQGHSFRVEVSMVRLNSLGSARPWQNEGRHSSQLGRLGEFRYQRRPLIQLTSYFPECTPSPSLIIVSSQPRRRTGASPPVASRCRAHLLGLVPNHLDLLQEAKANRVRQSHSCGPPWRLFLILPGPRTL